jgi:hypothetical protein
MSARENSVETSKIKRRVIQQRFTTLIKAMCLMGVLNCQRMTAMAIAVKAILAEHKLCLP